MLQTKFCYILVEEIEDLHKQYVTALVQLYDKYNPVYGDTNISLNIVWYITIFLLIFCDLLLQILIVFISFIYYLQICL